MPLMFAAGWWMRGINYDRDVQAAIDSEALETGGVFIPEMGIIRGSGVTSKKMKAMSPKAKAEMDRRIKYYAENFPHEAWQNAQQQTEMSPTGGFPRSGFNGSADR